MLHPARSPIIKPPRGTLINRAHPLARGLCGAWIFNENTGSLIADYSGNVKNGTLGTPNWVANGINITDAAYAATISDSSTGALDITDNISIIVGCELDALTSYSPFFSKRDSGGYQYQLRIVNNELNFLGSGGSRTSGLTLNTGEFLQVAISADGDAWDFYVNEDQAQQTSLAINHVDVGCFIGRTGSDSAYLDGRIYYAYIFDRALSADEVLAYLHNPYVIFSQSCAKYFNVAAGTTYTKDSGWRVFNSSGQTIAWHNLTIFSDDIAWRVLNDTAAGISWRVFNIKDEIVGWHILEQMATDSSWRVFNAAEKDVSWQILVAEIPESIITFALKKSSVFAFNLNDKSIITFNFKLQ